MKKVAKKSEGKKSKVGTAVAVGAAAVAAGAAAYALLGPNGKKNRAKVTKVVVNLKKKVADNKDVKSATAGIKKVVAEAKKDMKAVAKKASSAVKKATGTAKKVAKKVSSTAKKTVKKVAKKVPGKK